MICTSMMQHNSARDQGTFHEAKAETADNKEPKVIADVQRGAVAEPRNRGRTCKVPTISGPDQNYAP